MGKRLLDILLVASLLFCCVPTIGYATADFSKQIDKFSYEVLFPENQQKENNGYYDLLMTPGETQTVQLRVSNHSDKPLSVEIRINSAKTNGNGVIEYGENKLQADSSLVYDLAKIMTGPREVVLPANSSKIIDFKIVLPVLAFEGYLAGGIQLKPITETDPEAMIINKFAYLIGVLIRESAVETIIPELKLNDVSLKMKDGHYNLFVNLSNLKAVFVEQMSTTITIREINRKKPLIEFEQKGMRMAPNSMINLPISLNNQEISSGEYTAEIHITEKSGRTWNWVKNFTLMKVAAERIKAQKEEKTAFPLRKWGMLLLFSIGLSLVLLIILSRKRMQQKQTAKFKKKKRA